MPPLKAAQPEKRTAPSASTWPTLQPGSSAHGDGSSSNGAGIDILHNDSTNRNSYRSAAGGRDEAVVAGGSSDDVAALVQPKKLLRLS